MSTERLNDPGYKNWIKGVHGLFVLQKGLVKFMNEKCGEFHQKIEDALIAKCNEVPYCKVDCGKAIRGSNICQNCNHWYSEIKVYKQGALEWGNSKASKWMDDPWAVAKLFMGKGQHKKDKKSAEEFDCAALLQLIMNNKFFLNYVNANCERGDITAENAIQSRNELLHSANHILRQEELNSHLDRFIAVLNISKIRDFDQDDVTSTIADINKLKDLAYVVVEEHERQSIGEQINTIANSDDGDSTWKPVRESLKQLFQTQGDLKHNLEQQGFKLDDIMNTQQVIIRTQQDIQDAQQKHTATLNQHTAALNHLAQTQQQQEDSIATIERNVAPRGTRAGVGTNANNVDEVDAIPFEGMHIGPAAQANEGWPTTDSSLQADIAIRARHQTNQFPTATSSAASSTTGADPENNEPGGANSIFQDDVPTDFDLLVERHSAKLCTDKLFSRMSQRIPGIDQLGIWLNLKEGEIGQIKEGNKHSVSNQVLKLLQRWRQSVGREATLGKLVDALKDADIPSSSYEQEVSDFCNGVYD